MPLMGEKSKTRLKPTSRGMLPYALSSVSRGVAILNSLCYWCEGPDSNRHALRREILSLLSIPFLHTRVIGRSTRIRTLYSKLVSVVELESTTHGPKPRVSPSTPHRDKIMYSGKLLLLNLILAVSCPIPKESAACEIEL